MKTTFWKLGARSKKPRQRNQRVVEAARRPRNARTRLALRRFKGSGKSLVRCGALHPLHAVAVNVFLCVRAGKITISRVG